MSSGRSVGPMNGIGWAVWQMQNGERVCRPGWDGKGMWVYLKRAAPVIEAGRQVGIMFDHVVMTRLLS